MPKDRLGLIFEVSYAAQAEPRFAWDFVGKIYGIWRFSRLAGPRLEHNKCINNGASQTINPTESFATTILWAETFAIPILALTPANGGGVGDTLRIA